MPCQVIKIDGVTCIVKLAGRRVKVCKYCGRLSEKLCDFPLTGPKAGKTCDIPMCAKCATHVEPNTDFCMAHARLAVTNGKLAL